MKNAKRILCMLIAIAMVFSMAACGNESTDSVVDLGGDEQWDVNVNNDVDVNSSDAANTDSQANAEVNNATSNTQSGAASNTQSGAASNTQSGAANNQGTTNSQAATPNNQGTQATPNNQGTQATPNNQNTQAKPNNQGATPNNQGTQATPNNQGTQAKPNNQGTQSKPNNQGTQSATNNQGTQSKPNNQGTQSTPNNQGTQSKPNNQGTQSTPNNQNTQNNTTVQTPATQNPDTLNWQALLAQMPQNLRGTKLNVCSWNPIKDVTGAENVIANFEKQTGIDVVWTQKNYDNYDQDILALINSGSSPDIMRYNEPTPAKMSLTQDVKTATGFDFKGDIWDKNATNAYSVNGKIYGVNLKNTFNQQPSVVTYSMSTINRYELEDPYVLWKEGKWTWQKFKEMCMDFKEETGRPGWMTSGHTEALWVSGVDLFKFDGKTYKNNLSDPAVLKAVQQSANNMADGLVCEAMRAHDKLEDGTYLFFTTNVLATRRTDFHFATLKANDDLYAVPFPTGMSTDGKYYQHYQEFEAYGIPKGAKNAKAVYYFLRYYLNADNYDADMFFVNNQTLETYRYCMSQQNIHYSSDLTTAVNTDYDGISTFIRTGGTAAQVKNKLDELKPIYDLAVKQANATIAKF